MGETLLGLLTYSAGFQICHRHFCWCRNAELLFLAGSDGVKGDKTVNVCYDADVTFHLTHFDRWYSHCHFYLLKNFIMKNLDNEVN